MHIHLKKFAKSLDWVKNNPSLIFLLLSSVFGILFIFRLAPLNGTDEFTHFPRAYQISDGTFWEQAIPNQQYGGTLPGNVNNMISDYRDLSRKPIGLEYSNRQSQLFSHYSSLKYQGKNNSLATFTSVVTYPPWAYTPSVVGILIAKLFALPLIWYVYLGRLASLFVWICLTFGAIRLLPKGKWFILTVALLPTSLTQAATIGADGLLNGLSWLLIALFIAVLIKKVKLNSQVLILIPVLAVFASLIKVGYFLIPMAFLIIPFNYFPSKTVSRLWKTGLVALIGISSILFTMHNINSASRAVLTPRLGNYINSHDQVKYILHHPFIILVHILTQPFTKSYDTVYLGMVGIITNRLIYLSFFIVALLFLALFLTLKDISPSPALFKYRKRLLIALVAIIVGTYLLLALAFYVGNTQVGSSLVFGMYGRYFLPILPLLIVLPLIFRRETLSKTTSQRLLIIGILVVGLVSAVTSLK